jgi:hypothetical protein
VYFRRWSREVIVESFQQQHRGRRTHRKLGFFRKKKSKTIDFLREFPLP